MDRKHLRRLLDLGSDPLGDGGTALFEGDPFVDRWGVVGGELTALLRERDGFYAFTSALLVRPYQSEAPPLGIVEWNRPGLWKDDYEADLDEVLFFAESIFGEQFGLCAGRIWHFEPETGERTEFATSLEGWAERVLTERDFQTGYPFAHAWQVRNRSLDPGERLLPKAPFMLGGAHEIDSFYACSDVEGMRVRASIAVQTRGLPDGTKIEIRIRRRPEPDTR